MNGSEVPYHDFVKAVRTFYGLLKDVGEDVAEQREPVKWRISVESGSQVVLFHGIPKNPDVRVDRIVEESFLGLMELEGPDVGPSPRLPTSALERARLLAELSINGTGGISVGNNGDVSLISKATITSADKALRTEYQEYSSITGHLKVISDRSDGPKARVYDELTGRGVPCYFPIELWRASRADAIAAFEDRLRVLVYGLISYRSNGQASRIDVSDIDVYYQDDFDIAQAAGILRRVK